MANFNKNDKGSIAKNWIKVHSKTYPDKVYYYNLKTKCSSWTNPCKESDKILSNLTVKNIDKNVIPTSLSSSSLIKKKKKKKKIKEKLNVIKNLSVPPKTKNNIEDYDEHQEQYFKSVLNKAVNAPREKSEISNFNEKNVLDETNKNIKFSSQLNSSNYDLYDSKDLSSFKKEEIEISDKNKKISVDNFNVSKLVMDTGKKDTKNSGAEPFNDNSYKEKKKSKKERLSFKISKTPAQTQLLNFQKMLSNNNGSDLKKITLKKYSLRDKMPSNPKAIFKEYSAKKKASAQVKLLNIKKDLMSMYKLKENEKEYSKNCSSMPNKITPLISKSINLKNELLKKENAYYLLQTELEKIKEQNSIEKTPAQTQLLRFRKELSQDIDNMNHPSQKSLNEKTPAQTQLLKFRKELSQDIDNMNHPSQKTENCYSNNNINFVEEMDWDPVNDELDAKIINEFCDQMDVCKEIEPDAFDKVKSLNYFSTLSNSWILVPDTNIFVADLNFINEIKNLDVPDFGYPIIYVPWRVLQELDYLKSSKTDFQKERLALNARKSISYINENFRSKQNRFCGQSFEDFMNIVNVKNSNPDDEILETCLNLKKKYTDKKVVLLTNDKNLETKAIVSNLEAYSKNIFKSKFLSKSNNCDRDEVECVQSNNSEYWIKNHLNDFISKVIENEMEKAFGIDWIKICHKKPPWTLQDALKSFMKHWRSVFFILFSKDVFSNVEELHKLLYKSKKGLNQDFSEIINVSINLIKSFKIVPKSYVPYQKLGDELLEKLLNLEKSKSEDLNVNKFTQEKLVPCFVSDQLHNLADKTDINNQIPLPDSFKEDFALIKDLFLDIWESLKSFCIAVFELIQQGNLSNFHQVYEARQKLYETHSKVSTLISLLDLLVKVNSEDIKENHSLIIQLNDYLISLFCSMLPDVEKKLKKALVIFCSTLEGRSVMEKFLRELPSFLGYLCEAKNYLDTFFSFKT